jgi:hypothetical protein
LLFKALGWRNSSFLNAGNAKQVIGRERETATFIKICVVSFGLCVAGFAPRQRRRWAAFVLLCSTKTLQAKLKLVEIF